MNKPLWTKEEIRNLYHSPLLELVYRAATVHRQNHNAQEMQVCTLQSIKTGGCTENCGYCSQSVHHGAEIEKFRMLNVDAVLALAKEAKDNGSTRFCMGSAGREVKNAQDFENILEMVRGVSAMGLEVCCTLGQLAEEQAQRLKTAGLYAYNHNLDTGREFYPKVVTTRTYEDRLETIDLVGKAGISLCCGGILGMGESEEDRIDLLHTLAHLHPAPESVPVNVLVPIPGTPMEDQERIPTLEVIRMIATARVLLPKTMIRLSAGREAMNEIEQSFCFMAGANSIFSGDKLLTTPGPSPEGDKRLLDFLGMSVQKPYSRQQA